MSERNTFTIKDDVIFLHKKGRKVIFDDSIRIRMNEKNKKRLNGTSYDNHAVAGNTRVNGEVLHKAIERFINTFGDFTKEEKNGEMEFDISTSDMRFILFMSRKQGFVNFLLDWYYKYLEENDLYVDILGDDKDETDD